MDKNMINIDDLIRQGLGGREEEQRSGSWANMRSLLDKEMPVNPVATTSNWRKYSSLIAALLLVSAVSVGGYKAVQCGYITLPGSHKSDTNLASNAGNNGKNDQGSNANTVAAVSNSSSVASSGQTSSHPAGNTANNNNIDNTNKTNNTNTVAVQPTTNNNGSKANNTNQRNNTQNTNTSSSSSISGSIAGTKHGPHIREAKNDDSRPAHTAPAVPVPGPSSTSEKANAQSMNSNITIAATTATASTVTKNAADRATTNGPRTGKANTGSDVNTFSNSTSSTQKNGAGQTQTNKNKNTVSDNLAVRKDTIELINLISRTVVNPYTGKKSIFIDTETIERVVVDRPIPAPYQLVAKKTETKKVVNEIIPASSASASLAAADGEIRLEPLSNHRVSTRKTGWDPQKFEEMFLQVKYNLSKIKFYTGMTGGVNGSFINGFMPGIHLGLTGNIVFNDNWNVMTEIKYNHRFNNRTQIDDNYSRALYQYDGGNGKTIFVRDSFEHYFNFSSLGNFELPIMLRYSHRQFFASAGVSLVYNLGVNVEELTNGNKIYDTVSNSITEPRPNISAKISTEDFRSRFGVGYVFGAGYQFTPAVSLDLRMTQTLWDNMSKAGAQNVSKQLFFKPAAQLSVSYRFGQRQH